MSADSVKLAEVRRASEIGAASELGDSGETLLVERPAEAREGALSGVFVVDQHDVLRRVLVKYGRAAGSRIQVVSGLSPGDRIVVSDMRAWDAFERLQLKSR